MSGDAFSEFWPCSYKSYFFPTRNYWFFFFFPATGGENKLCTHWHSNFQADTYRQRKVIIWIHLDCISGHLASVCLITTVFTSFPPAFSIWKHHDESNESEAEQKELRRPQRPEPSLKRGDDSPVFPIMRLTPFYLETLVLKKEKFCRHSVFLTRTRPARPWNPKKRARFLPHKTFAKLFLFFSLWYFLSMQCAQ